MSSPTTSADARTRVLLAGVVALTNLLVFSLGGYFLHQSRLQHESRAEALVQNLAKAIDQNVSASIAKIDLALAAVTDDLERQLAAGGIRDSAASAALETHLRRLPELEALRVADADGHVILGRGVDRGKPASWAGREYFRTHAGRADAGLVITKPLLGRVSGKWHISLTRRYNHPDGRFAGVVAAPLALDHLAQLLASLDAGPNGTIVLRDGDLGLIARHPPVPDGQPAGIVGNASVSRELRELVAAGAVQGTYHTQQSADRYERTVAFRRLTVAPMIAIVGTDVNDYLADWRGEVRLTVAFLAAFFLVTLAAAGLLWRSLRLASRESQRFRALIEASAQIVWSCNSRGQATEDSPSWRAYTGQTVEQWRGYGYVDCIHPDDRAATMARWQDALARGEAVINEYRLRHRSGEWRWNLARGVPLRDARDEVSSWVGMNIDIHDRKTAELALRTAKEQAEAASIAKSRFLATMSHEIRTPMNGILGMAQLLLMPGIDEAERLDYARTILNSGQTLLTLLNDILDLSKVEAGKLELASAAFDPGRIIQETAALFAEPAQAKGLALTAAWSGPAGQRYQADPVRLRQMLANLVSNAIKFTGHGHVRIEAAELERDDATALLEFAVSDSGIGVPADQLDRLFKSFSQVDSSTTRQYGGTGLGLAIVRQLARLMGGDVGVSSAPGSGSRFWFRVRANLVGPGEEARAAGRAGTAAAAVAGRRILVVEDNPVNRQVVETLLAKRGFQVGSVADGQAAVAAITGGDTADLVLMDCQMPVMDGYQATERIRAWETAGGKPRRPIVALTASAFEEDRHRCLAAGMDDFLTKPVNVNDLAAALEKWLGIARD